MSSALSKLLPSNHKDLRMAFGCYATGVAVVLVDDTAATPHGLTINSFTSVSLSPPLILWSLARRSAMLPLFARTECFSVNILSYKQRHLAEALSQAHGHHVPRQQWRRGQTGAPILASGLVNLECRVRERLNGGDHVIFLSDVAHIHCSQHKPEDALLYISGAYHRLS